MTEEYSKLKNDLFHLARVALSERPQDLQMYLQRLIKQHSHNEPELSRSLLDLVRKAPTRSSPLRRNPDMVMPVDTDSRFNLLRIEEVPILAREPIYSPEITAILDRLIAERRRSEILISEGLEPTKTVLFTGPPGVGKTLAARWLARTLEVPLLTLDLSAVMSSYLGRTGTNLKHVIDFAKSTQCVLLLDELDAIAKRRDDSGEVGELKRLVTVLLQQLDDWPSTNLLVSATNHANLLDPAVWRRFEQIVEFPLPQRSTAQNFISTLLENRSKDASNWGKMLAIAFAESSFSDIERKVNVARRTAAINSEDLDSHLLQLIDGEIQKRGDRIELATELVNAGFSQRRAQEVTGVARQTIRKHTKK